MVERREEKEEEKNKHNEKLGKRNQKELIYEFIALKMNSKQTFKAKQQVNISLRIT